MVRTGRPRRWRRVDSMPAVTYFKPAGIRLINLQEVCLSVEEAEAIRLKDLEGLEHEDCASRMNVSRTTFARILDSGRQKMADALLNGKAIRIEGGNYQMALSRFRCDGGHEWEVPFEMMVDSPPEFCPVCNTEDIVSVQPMPPRSARGGLFRQRRRGNNW